MRKVLILAAALVLCAGPALAQQQADAAATPAQVAVKAAQAPQADAATQPVPQPSLFLTTEQIRQQVQAAQAEREGREAQLGSSNWWYLVAAIAIGIIIAALVPDGGRGGAPPVPVPGGASRVRSPPAADRPLSADGSSAPSRARR